MESGEAALRISGKQGRALYALIIRAVEKRGYPEQRRPLENAAPWEGACGPWGNAVPDAGKPLGNAEAWVAL